MAADEGLQRCPTIADKNRDWSGEFRLRARLGDRARALGRGVTERRHSLGFYGVGRSVENFGASAQDAGDGTRNFAPVTVCRV